MGAISDSYRKLDVSGRETEDEYSESSGSDFVVSFSSEPRPDVLDVLKASVSDLGVRTTEAYARLAQHMTRLRERMEIEAIARADREAEEQNTLMAQEEAAQAQADLLGATEARATALEQEVNLREEELAEATQRIAQLKEEAVVYTSEMARMQEMLDEKALAQRQQDEDLERVRFALSSARDQLTAARALSGKSEEYKAQLDVERTRAERAESLLRDKEAEAAAAFKQAKVLQERMDEIALENAKEVEALKSEIELLRRANASLALPDAEPSEESSETKPVVSEPQSANEPRKIRMGDLLVDMGALSEKQLDAALREQQSEPHRRLGGILVDCGFVSEDVVAKVLARQLELPFVRLNPEIVDSTAPKLISGQLAKRRLCIPIKVTDDNLVLAMANPQDLITMDDVKLSSGRAVEPVVATGTDIAAAIVRYYGLS
jgi:hypothetical protein